MEKSSALIMFFSPQRSCKGIQPENCQNRFFRFAVAIQDDKGEIVTASSEDSPVGGRSKRPMRRGENFSATRLGGLVEIGNLFRSEAFETQRLFRC